MSDNTSDKDKNKKKIKPPDLNAMYQELNGYDYQSMIASAILQQYKDYPYDELMHFFIVDAIASVLDVNIREPI